MRIRVLFPLLFWLSLIIHTVPGHYLPRRPLGPPPLHNRDRNKNFMNRDDILPFLNRRHHRQPYPPPLPFPNPTHTISLPPVPPPISHNPHYQNFTQLYQYLMSNHNASSTYYLSELISETILDVYRNHCQVNVLNSGFLTINNTDTDSKFLNFDNATLNSPALFLRCNKNTTFTTSNGTIYDSGMYFASILKIFAETAPHLPLTNHTDPILQRDHFMDGMIMITFNATAICVGSWMIYLLLLLLPSDNHNNKRIIVHIYVLFFAVVHTAQLKDAVDLVFKVQYLGNYQNSQNYENKIVNSNTYRVCEIVSNVLSNINWILLVFYMYHNNNEINFPQLKRFTPRWLNTKNRLIFIVGSLLSISDNIMYGILLWKKDLDVLRGFYKALELTIYSLFIYLISAFIWNNFGFILTPRRIKQQREKNSIKKKFQLLWNDYHETIPLMIYNFVVFVLSFVLTILFTANNFYLQRWKYDIIYFLKLLITTNVWGLFGVLEKREIILHKRTVLGRKITNSDKYFSNPFMEYSDNDENGTLDNQSISNNNNEDCKHLKLSLSYPLTIWRSGIKRFKDHRALHKESNKLRTKHQLQKNDNTLLSATTLRSGRNLSPSFSSVHEQHIYDSDAISQETELTRNFIYDHD
ncbi:hypothetical protein NCAS_0G00790 [Naumovozyma castellii]|uniref:Uncharacterized protein n=1 Tax=Naumovozyma castellii TaxID=27288 RepID=G0VHT2_NAUCA|nr:hypothetical protein NCAS_0G00790 [Naumovozyma castellii CBS 4309]CCC70966.1 hypothetical protein NCAS_0G00790 [Naumovozyma castellii CBS 4309]